MSSNSTVHLFHRCAVSGFHRVPSTGQRLEDSVCWEMFIQTYGRLLRASIRGAFYRCRAPFTIEDIEEAEQEVYCRLLEQGRRRLQQFRGRREGQARRFLRRVSWSVVVDTLRHGSAQKRGGRMIKVAASSTDVSVQESISHYSSTPELEALQKERSQELLRGCRVIAARSSHGLRNLRILHWALVEGRTSREISRHLEFKLSVSAIDSVIHRIRRGLEDQGLRLPGRGKASPGC